MVFKSILQGIGASPGIAIGKAFLMEKKQINIVKVNITDVGKEIQRLYDAIYQSRKQINQLLDESSPITKEILETHMMILQDPELTKSVEGKIEVNKVNCEEALQEVIDMYVATFEAMEDEYFRERSVDIKDVGQRLMRNLLGMSQNLLKLEELQEAAIFVSYDMTPSDTVQMKVEKVLGIITAIGGKASHSAIIARSMELPAVVGIGQAIEEIKTGDLLIIDGKEGSIFVNPDEEILKAYQRAKEMELTEKRELLVYAGKKTFSKDGQRVKLCCNIGKAKDSQKALDQGAEGIGLFRTEFLFMNRTNMPNEEEQFDCYREVLEIMGDRPVIIRTLDVGGDKDIPYLGIEKEMNPFLGYRGIRVCLDNIDMFKTQLRALLRASAFGNLKIMYPMISSVEEVRKANTVLKEVEEELNSEGINFSEDIKVGIMIETPASVVISDLLAKEVDFFSIGTNDLIQYVAAVDRMNEKVAHLYNPFNPAVLRLLQQVIVNGHQAGIKVGMCGEMAGDEGLIPVLLGMGLDEFSMSASALLPARKLIAELSYEDMKGLAKRVLELSTAEEIEKFVKMTLDNIKY